MQSVVSSLIKNTQLSNASRILDIESGLGQPTMHCYIHPGVALSYGIEVSMLRHVWAIENLEKVLEADWTNKTNKMFLAHGNISDAKTLDPFSLYTVTTLDEMSKNVCLYDIILHEV